MGAVMSPETPSSDQRAMHLPVTIYLDYNVISSAIGIPQQADALVEVAAIGSLAQRGARFVLSAWTAYELARSLDVQHVRQCCAFIEGLQPLWVSDARHIVDREIAAFLARHRGTTGEPRGIVVQALNETIGQMWSTYGVHIAARENFTDCVREMRRNPQDLDTILQAAGHTPQAITATRAAPPPAQGTGSQPQALEQDRAYFAARLRARRQDERVDFLIASRAQLYRESPMLAIEDALMRVRGNDSFKPNPSHAADFQHGVAALACCNHFVTRDGQLRGHARIVIKELGLQCRVHARVATVCATSGPLAAQAMSSSGSD